ncbi:PREDICTED: LOB domain-containing protein 38-like [Ipomoea nil]|uniref:LOB domain-containing protein 38-like n=1 Tax=Ipomoea nil TaxID=35883 RepID=UPI0009016159|nr:PREDICTED: LOB domain-containing protein 38-like [Ipomoea nil]
MSCNGCRILRKGCNENCILRESLQGIITPQAQANATLFVAKFFGRAGLMSFLSSVPASQRPALFQSLLFEACGRTVNPVHGAVGLLWTGNWHLCQTAVETVLRGGVLHAPPSDESAASEEEETDDTKLFHPQEASVRAVIDDLDLGLRTGMPPARMSSEGKVNRQTARRSRRSGTPSGESEITTSESSYAYQQQGNDVKLLRLFL